MGRAGPGPVDKSEGLGGRAGPGPVDKSEGLGAGPARAGPNGPAWSAWLVQRAGRRGEYGNAFLFSDPTSLNVRRAQVRCCYNVVQV